MAIAFFDLDKTIVAGSSAAAFVDVLRREKLLSWKAVTKIGLAHAQYKMNGGHQQSMKLAQVGLEMTKGWHRPTVRALIDAELQNVIDPILYPDAVRDIAHHKERGDVVTIVSSSPEDVVQPIATYLGVESVIASRARLDADDRCTGELTFLAYAETKPGAMAEVAQQHGQSMNDAYAYSDSITDLPMLEAVGHPVVINPDDELRSIATEHNWDIRTYTLDR